MKLRQISENFLIHKLRDQMQSSGYFNRPMLHSDQPYQASSGHDAGSRTSGNTSMATGVPRNPRHRRFLGIANRSGTIRL